MAKAKKSRRYATSHLPENQYESGSRGRVLRNLLGIKNEREMDRVEVQKLKRAEDILFRTYDQDHRFTASDICYMHKLWLGKVYEWAGNYRQVKLTKGSFPFAFPAQVPQLMELLEKGPLHRYTPCRSKSKERVIRALAEVHTELVLIHPFREGKKREEYFAAVQAGLGRNYKPMETIFRLVVEKTLTDCSSI